MQKEALRLGQKSLALFVFAPVDLAAREALAENFKRRLAAGITPPGRRCLSPAAAQYQHYQNDDAPDHHDRPKHWQKHRPWHRAIPRAIPPLHAIPPRPHGSALLRGGGRRYISDS